jgi:hypothetical protein
MLSKDLCHQALESLLTGRSGVRLLPGGPFNGFGQRRKIQPEGGKPNKTLAPKISGPFLSLHPFRRCA